MISLYYFGIKCVFKVCIIDTDKSLATVRFHRRLFYLFFLPPTPLFYLIISLPQPSLISSRSLSVSCLRVVIPKLFIDSSYMASSNSADGIT